MKRKLCMLVSFLFVLSLTTGCGGSDGSSDSGQKKTVYERPEILDLTIREDAVFENVDGCFVETRSDFLELGYPDWDGEMLQQDIYPALAERIGQVNEELLSRQVSEHKYLMETAPYSDDEEIYFRSDTVVTRNDNIAVSFYYHIDYYDGYGGQEWQAVNIDSKTGQELQMEDVFTDRDELSDLLVEALQEAYPELSDHPDLADIVHDMLGDELEFALSYGFVHFFFQEYTLPDSIEGHHVVLSLADHPELVQEPYRVLPERYMLELEYDTDVLMENGNRLCMGWDMSEEWSGSIIWSMAVNGEEYTEEFYGYAPQTCYLLHKNSRDYLYLQEPAGDISKATNVYKVRSNVKKLGRPDMGMHSQVNLNPDRMLMDMNDMLFMEDMHFIPYGIFTVGRDGFPVSVKGSEYGITGSPVMAKETFRIYMTDTKDASVEEGFTTVAGQLSLQAFRTDRETYMDFLTEDGRAIRLTIDGWSDEMKLYGGDALTDVIEADLNYFEW